MNANINVIYKARVRNSTLSLGEGRGEVYSAIAGGVGNCIYATQSTNSVYNVIGGGSYNTISACYSAILGGKRNTVSHNYAGVFGNGVSSVAANTFHVNCLNACDTPSYIAGLPVGTIFKFSGGTPPVGTPLYII